MATALHMIKNHLRPRKITARKGTIQSDFAAAIAPHDEYDEAMVRELLRKLGQDPDKPLTCVYCDAEADTWDHVVGTVSNKEFSGVGHRLRNLVPCCSHCNTRKGKKNWREYLDGLEQSPSVRDKRARRIAAHITGCKKDVGKAWRNLPEYEQLQATRENIFKLMEEGDKLAAILRGKLRAADKSVVSPQLQRRCPKSR